MKIGYSYWGYLGDTKYDTKGKMASTPDGNAFYSWSIINHFIREGATVYQIMPDRDYIGIEKEGIGLFSWCTNQRYIAYDKMIKFYKAGDDWSIITKEKLFNAWNNKGLNECDIILHEWRMLIQGRNDDKTKQPDWFIQWCLIEYCADNNIPLIIFDLDYKLTLKEYVSLLSINKNTFIFELGYKWKRELNAFHVEIPFSFEYIHEYPLLNFDFDCNKRENLIYVGNRYERDWCIDKYIPTELSDVIVYGNWLEFGRDSKERWPNITFGPRVQTADMPRIYQNSLCTILLAKQEYLDYSFMTARILEAIFYGCIPLFIEEYGRDCIRKYAGCYAEDLTVSSKADVINMSQYIKYNDSYRRNVIAYLRSHLSFMDVSNFVLRIHEILYNVKKGE